MEMKSTSWHELGLSLEFSKNKRKFIILRSLKSMFDVKGEILLFIRFQNKTINVFLLNNEIKF